MFLMEVIIGQVIFTGLLFLQPLAPFTIEAAMDCILQFEKLGGKLDIHCFSS